LPFAETASPPSGAEFDAKRAAVEAVVAAEAARVSAPPAAYQPSPSGAQPLGVVGATPGIAAVAPTTPNG